MKITVGYFLCNKKDRVRYIRKQHWGTKRYLFNFVSSSYLCILIAYSPRVKMVAWYWFLAKVLIPIQPIYSSWQESLSSYSGHSRRPYTRIRRLWSWRQLKRSWPRSSGSGYQRSMRWSGAASKPKVWSLWALKMAYGLKSSGYRIKKRFDLSLSSAPSLPAPGLLSRHG